MPQGRFFESLPEEKTFYESHRRHLDIHVVIKGEERMDISSLDDLQVDEEKSDLEKGDFFVLRENLMRNRP